MEPHSKSSLDVVSGLEKKRASSTSWVQGTVHAFLIAKGSFQISHLPSTWHTAFPATLPEGQNRSYLSAARDLPDVHLGVASPHSKTLRGAERVPQTHPNQPSPVTRDSGLSGKRSGKHRAHILPGLGFPYTAGL